MALFLKGSFHRRLSIVALSIFVSLLALDVGGCATINRLLGREQVEKPKNSFLKKLTDQDVPGQDIKDLPRYPGSIRVSYTIVTGDGGKRSGTIAYQTADSKDKVINYYAGATTANSWMVSEIVETAEGRIFQLVKEGRRISLSVARRPRSKLTDITLVYREY